MRRIYIPGVILFFTALATIVPSAQTSAANGSIKLPEVQCDTVADGFCDFALAIEKKTMEADGSLLLTVAGTHKSQALELQIAIAPGMRPGAMNPLTERPQAYSLQRGGVRFERTGGSSDRFVDRLAELYHSKSRPKAMASDIHFTAFVFRGDPEKIDSREVLFELSHDDPANKVPECGMLLEVNLPAGEVRIREKDQDFRDCVIRILGGSE